MVINRMVSNCKHIPHKFTILNNISLHVLILFIILSALFVFYISKIESEAINDEVIKYINDFNLDTLDPKYKTIITKYVIDSIKNPSNNKAEHDFVNNIGKDCSPTDSFPCNPGDPDPLSPEERALLNNTFLFNTKNIINEKIDSLNSKDNTTIDNLIKKMNIDQGIFKDEYFDYIIKNLQQNKNQLAEQINRKILEELGIVIGFLILIAIIINIIPVNFLNYCNDSIMGIIGELICVFILIGCIEAWFFNNVAYQYVATKPSLIIQTFKDKLLSVLS